jgi:DNA repair exonuclease SbcCD nuclease subunit
MRILQLGDTHLGAAMRAHGPSGWSRAHDHHAALEASLQPVFRGEVDLVLHTGDVFDRSRPPRRWVEAAGELLLRVARHVPVLGIAGNHDRRGIRRWLPHPQLSFVDQPTRVVVGEVAIGLVPYCRTPEGFARAAARATGPGVDLLAMHQAPHGSRVPGLVFQAGVHGGTVGAEHLPAGVRHVACGHIHPRQVVPLGRATVVCGGSTERTAFSEAQEAKGTVLWSFEREVTHRFVDHPTRPMADVFGGLVRCTAEEAGEVRRRGRVAAIRSDRAVPGRAPRVAGGLFATGS